MPEEIYIEAINITDVEKRKVPQKHYVYIINVVWSNKKQQVICRRYNDFFHLQTSLIDAYPEEAGVYNPTKRILPFLPGKILFGRSQVREVAMKRKNLINEYLQKLINLKEEISRNEIVINFLEASEDDIKSLMGDPKKKTKSVKTADNISDPILLEQFIVIADFKKTDRKQISLAAGDTVDVMEKHENGWWFVSLEDEQGWAPSSYLEPIDGEEDKAKPEILQPGKEEKFICARPFESKLPDEQSLKAGDVVDVTEKHPDGWWKIRLSKGNECTQGFVPAAHLKKMPKSTEAQLMHIQTPSPKTRKQFVPPPRKKTVRRKFDPQTSKRPQEKDNLASGKKAPPPVPKEKKVSVEEEVIYVATSNFKTDNVDSNLKFREGAEIEVLEKDPNGWWYVRVDGEEGWVPSTMAQRERRQKDLKNHMQKEHPEGRKQQYVAIGAYKATDDTGISFQTGDLVEIINTDPCGWWYVKIKGDEGWAPSTFLEKVREKEKVGNRLSNGVHEVLETIPIGVGQQSGRSDSPLPPKKAAVPDQCKITPPNARKVSTSREDRTDGKPKISKKPAIAVKPNISSELESKLNFAAARSESQSPDIPQRKTSGPAPSDGRSSKSPPVRPRKPASKPAEPLYEAMGDYHDDEEGMLNLIKGQTVTVIEKDDGGWWLAESGGQTGWVPSNFLKEL